MPIAINGSGTITGISVGGIPDGTVDTDVLAANAVTFAKIGTTEQGQLCKAWVNFNGTGTVAIRASYNVSSITDNGTGDYTVNFTSALADANYAVVGIGTSVGNGDPGSNVVVIKAPSETSAATTMSTSAVRVITGRFSSQIVDLAYVLISVFR
jgi:hypothetical protein